MVTQLAEKGFAAELRLFKLEIVQLGRASIINAGVRGKRLVQSGVCAVSSAKLDQPKVPTVGSDKSLLLAGSEAPPIEVQLLELPLL